ncbi:hypothetical protein BGX20_000839 [Mortierella sp. AD010]|nr:hypothetical protein BGX20_000839 [Mortierella sp. AD010]
MRHSYQELYRLSSKFMLNEDGTASVTIIINPQDFGESLSNQIHALLTQTDQPQSIWVAVAEDQDITAAEDLIATFNDSSESSTAEQSEDDPNNEENGEIEDEDEESDQGHRVKMRVFAKSDPWWSVARHASSEFFLLLENGVIPGANYLGTLLRLAHTPEYSRSLLGSHGAVLLTAPEDTLDNDVVIKCLPEKDSRGQVRATEAVDVLTDIWFGRTEALELLSLEPWGSSGKAPLGIYLSTILRYHGSIQSIVVANDPRNLATWGDVRKKDHPPTFCTNIRQLYKESVAWQSWIERGRALVTQNERLASIVIFLSSHDEAVLLKDLICRWSLSPDISIHIAVSGSSRGLGRKDLARLLPSEGCHVGIYDLHLSHVPIKPTPLESARLAADVSVNTFHLINSLRPKVIFYLKGQDASFAEGLAIAQERAKVPVIAISPEDVEHVGWLPDLSVKALESKCCIYSH